MNTLIRLAVSLSLVGLTSSLPITVMATTDAKTPTKVTKQNASLLFVLRADTGVVSKTDTGYTLTLKSTDDKVLYFSDRPVRKAGFITMTQFMSGWAKGKNNFQVDSPNAAIVHGALKTNEKGIAQAIPVELIRPRVTASGWTFDLKDLQGKISMGTYNGVSVFIDPRQLGCVWSEITSWC